MRSNWPANTQTKPSSKPGSRSRHARRRRSSNCSACRKVIWPISGTDGPDKSTRPNMIVACGLNYKMLDEELQLEVIRTVRQHLLTPRGCGHSRPATCSTKVRWREDRPQNAISRARTVRHGPGCCSSTSRHASISTGMHSCRRPEEMLAPTSTRTSRPTASGRFESSSMPTPYAHRAGLFRRRGASGPCSISTA